MIDFGLTIHDNRIILLGTDAEDDGVRLTYGGLGLIYNLLKDRMMVMLWIITRSMMAIIDNVSSNKQHTSYNR